MEKVAEMIYTTLNKIRSCHPCEYGWKKLLASLGKTQADDDPLPLVHILDSNGLDDTLWCLRTVPGYDREWRLYAVWCAKQVEHLMTDERSRNALDVAERHADGGATDEELAVARDAAREAARSAAGDAAWDAARTAKAAAGSAAWDAARTTAWAAARTAAWAAAWVAPWDAARDTQTEKFRSVLEEIKP